MKRILTSVLAIVMACFCLASCKQSEKKDLTSATSLADLKGAKIAAQSGTFHADAVNQIEGVVSSVYPDFTDLLVALNSGAIDGYVAEEPTALAVCAENSGLTYVKLKNNDTGFTAGAEDVGIAIGCKDGSSLVEQINAVLDEIPQETKDALMAQMVSLSMGENVDELALKSEKPAQTTGTLKVGMECGYEPYNWTETGEKTIGCVPISGEGKSGLYANGYDVQIAQYVANKLGLELEIYSYKWDSLLPAVQSGAIDAIVAGMSPTAEREKEIDFTKTYWESNLVVIIKK